MHASASECLDHELARLSPERLFGERSRAGGRIEVELLEGDCAARPDVRRDPSQRLGWIPPVHEDEPAHGGIETPIELGCARVALDEAHVTQPERLRATACHLERGTVDFHADDLALGTDKLGRQQGNVSRTAAHLEDAHARLEAGRAEEPLGRGFEDGRLVAQALVFLPRARQRVARVVLRTRRAAAGLRGMTHDLRMNHPSGTRIGRAPCNSPIHHQELTQPPMLGREYSCCPRPTGAGCQISYCRCWRRSCPESGVFSGSAAGGTYGKSRQSVGVMPSPDIQGINGSCRRCPPSPKRSRRAPRTG